MVNFKVSVREVTIPVRNESGRATRLVVEPWGDEWAVEAGTQVDVILRGPEGFEAETIQQADGIVIVFGWPGSTYAVLSREDAEPVMQSDIPVPALPRGKSMKDFVQRFFYRLGD